MLQKLTQFNSRRLVGLVFRRSCKWSTRMPVNPDRGLFAGNVYIYQDVKDQIDIDTVASMM